MVIIAVMRIVLVFVVPAYTAFAPHPNPLIALMFVSTLFAGQVIQLSRPRRRATDVLSDLPDLRAVYAEPRLSNEWV